MIYGPRNTMNFYCIVNNKKWKIYNYKMAVEINLKNPHYILITIKITMIY